MGYTLDESDSQGIRELLDAIYASSYDEEVFNSALVSLKTLIGMHIITTTMIS